MRWSRVSLVAAYAHLVVGELPKVPLCYPRIELSSSDSSGLIAGEPMSRRRVVAHRTTLVS